MDNVSRSKRSEIMSRVRSSGNKSTELKLLCLFKNFHITGWRRNSKLFGKPDFVFTKQKIAVFVDGCFWHGCALCKKRKIPLSNRDYWKKKISKNRIHDREVSKKLKSLGYRVIRIRECSLKKRPVAQLKRVIRYLKNKAG